MKLFRDASKSRRRIRYSLCSCICLSFCFEILLLTINVGTICVTTHRATSIVWSSDELSHDSGLVSCDSVSCPWLQTTAPYYNWISFFLVVCVIIVLLSFYWMTYVHQLCALPRSLKYVSWMRHDHRRLCTLLVCWTSHIIHICSVLNVLQCDASAVEALLTANKVFPFPVTHLKTL